MVIYLREKKNPLAYINNILIKPKRSNICKATGLPPSQTKHQKPFICLLPPPSTPYLLTILGVNHPLKTKSRTIQSWQSDGTNANVQAQLDTAEAIWLIRQSVLANITNHPHIRYRMSPRLTSPIDHRLHRSSSNPRSRLPPGA